MIEHLCIATIGSPHCHPCFRVSPALRACPRILCSFGNVANVNSMSLAVKTNGRREFIYPPSEEKMDFQTKLFRWPDRGNYVIMIARGQTNISGFQQIFQKLAEIHEALVDWRV